MGITYVGLLKIEDIRSAEAGGRSMGKSWRNEHSQRVGQPSKFLIISLRREYSWLGRGSNLGHLGPESNALPLRLTDHAAVVLKSGVSYKPVVRGLAR